MWCAVRVFISRLDERNDSLGGSRTHEVSRSSWPLETEPYVASIQPLLVRNPFILTIAVLVSGRERFAAEAVRKNFFKIVGAWRPALLTHGYPEDVVDNWIAKAQEEMISMKPHIYVGVSRLPLVH